MKKAKFLTGFTLIELLVVISIIGLLSSVVFASLNPARIKAKNSQIIQQYQQYEKALWLYYDDFGYFPSGSTGGTKCILDPADGRCGPNNEYLVDAQLNEKLRKYMNSLPTSSPLLPVHSLINFEGYGYFLLSGGKLAEIDYYLFGNASCAGGYVGRTFTGQVTYCVHDLK